MDERVLASAATGLVDYAVSARPNRFILGNGYTE